MKIKISLISNNSVILKTGYNYQLQSLIYNLLDKSSREQLHYKGFMHNNRSFKLFVFSEILEKGTFNKERKEFRFGHQVSFYLFSPIDWILEQVAKNSVMTYKLQLGNNIAQVSTIEVLKEPEIKERRIRIKAITPIEVHSTLNKSDGGKKTYYYSPLEKEFSELINSNLKKKWEILNKNECPYNIKIFPVRREYCKEKVRNFKGTVIKGWQNHFYMEGDKELLALALETGIGSRNSAGFGMVGLMVEE